MKEHCQNCGKEITGKRAGAKFCGPECKNEYNYKIRTKGQNGGLKGLPNGKINPLELSLSGVIEPEQQSKEPENQTQDQVETVETEEYVPQRDPKIIPIKHANIDADFFNELISGSIIDSPVFDKFKKSATEDSSEPEENYEEKDEDQDDRQNTISSDFTGQNQLLEQYIEQDVNQPNPVYQLLKNKETRLLKDQTTVIAEIDRLKKELAHQQKRDGSTFVSIGSVIGGASGLLSLPAPEIKLPEKSQGKGIPVSKRKKTNTASHKQEPSFFESFLNIAFKTALGYAAGKVMKAATEDWREKDKKEQIAKIETKLSELNTVYHDVSAAVARLRIMMVKTPEFIPKKEKVLNPAYTKALIELSGFKTRSEINEMKKNNVAATSKKADEPKFKSNKILKATELGKMDYKAFNFKGLWKDFFGLPSINFKCLIHGNSGEGKSTFCVWLAKYLAQNFGRVLYVSGEEGINKTFHDKLKYCQAEVPNLYVLDVRTGDDFIREIAPNEFHFIILDSLHDMEIDAKKMKEIFERYKNSAFICIDQNNKKGELLGANEKKHIVDIVVNVKNYIAETTKNRFKPKGVIFKTEDFIKLSSKIQSKRNDDDDGNGFDLNADRKGVI